MISSATRPEAYDLASLIGRGLMFGRKQPIVIRMLDLPHKTPKLKALVNELMDSAELPLEDIVAITDPDIAFRDIDVAIMLDTVEFGESLSETERQKQCLKIYKGHAEFLEKHGKQTIKIAKKLEVPVETVKNVVVWGKAGPFAYIDMMHSNIQMENGKTTSAVELMKNDHWIKHTFIPHLREKCSENMPADAVAILKAKAIVEHVHDLWLGTCEDWTSMVVYSNGEYGVAKDIFFGYPVTIPQPRGNPEIITHLPFADWAVLEFERSAQELVCEKERLVKLCEGTGSE
ncbi:unnamed protein product [Mesocestoides corti]|uniref:Lactate/malate dehydrogenase C-terminal domain-containing protein n=1 Tax=Mesocestoides corti TaxID=53468 RepID=A0A3P6GRG0_MESCO|nr:unnamed protein product [Mesocestoides corti]